MSIVDSRTERDAAIARLADTSAPDLERDLVHWTVASVESASEFIRVNERLQQIRELHAEEQGWVSLIGEELAKRRAARRAP